MPTHAIAKLYHCTNLCNACCKCEKILGGIIPTWSPGGEEWYPSDMLDEGGSLRTERVQFSS